MPRAYHWGQLMLRLVCICTGHYAAEDAELARGASESSSCGVDLVVKYDEMN